MSSVEVSGDQTVASTPLAAVQQPVRGGTRGDRRFAVGTLVIGAIAVHSNPPVSIDVTFVTTIRTVERRLTRRGISEGWVGGHRGSIYRF